MKKRNILSLLIVGFFLATSVTSCDTNEVNDQIANLAYTEDEHVLGVKNGTYTEYPDITWGEAFEYYFSYPTWKYFKGTIEGPDDNEDGEPDYIETDKDIVEFTGYCMYRDTKVKARLQFEIYANDTFDPTFLAFNEVPQLSLIRNLLINSAFEDYQNHLKSVSTTVPIEDTKSVNSNDFKSIKSANTITSEVAKSGSDVVTTSDNIKAIASVNNEKKDSADTNNSKKGSSNSNVQNQYTETANFEDLTPYLTGQISSGGATIEGYTSDYICYGGAKSRQWICEDTWHITAKRIAYAYDIIWFECWDTDDGDYYGWIDSDYLDFFSDIYDDYSEFSYPEIESVFMYGQLNTHGGTLPGYSTDYLIYDGAYDTIRDSLGHEWHIIAKNRCYTRDTYWYECWDSDDGDYYGWVDSYHIDFY